MTRWSDWASNLAVSRKSYQRPPNVVGMVTDDELHFLEAYARDFYTGAGTIVDLGCWLGATTAALARGVADNPQRERPRPIEAYDLFVWYEWMDPIARILGLPQEHHPGDDFLEHTRAILAPWEHLIRLHKADLSQETSVSDPVEFLMIDAMKSWPLANAISRNFFPELIAGKSLVVQQDFLFHSPIIATNHVLMWALREWFEPVHQVPRSTSVVFLNTRQLTREELQPIEPTQLTPEAVDAAWRYSLEFVDPAQAGPVLLCKLLFLLELGWPDAALAAAREFADAAPWISEPARADLASAIEAARSRADQGRMDPSTLDRIADLGGVS